MPDRNNNILKYDPKKKNPLEVSNVFYTDFECELKKNRFMPKKSRKTLYTKKIQA